MMDFGWSGGAWWIVWMTLCVGLIAVLVWAAVRAAVPRNERPKAPHGPKDVLAERFAKGEIGADEYHERLRVLDETLRTVESH